MLHLKRRQAVSQAEYTVGSEGECSNVVVPNISVLVNQCKPSCRPCNPTLLTKRGGGRVV